jgi:uncharacterized membrane protein
MLDRVLTKTAFQARNRAIVKTLGYRLLMVVITVVVAWAIIGKVSDALDIGIITNLVKTGTYYTYERLWDRVTWGVATNA